MADHPSSSSHHLESSYQPSSAEPSSSSQSYPSPVQPPLAHYHQHADAGDEDPSSAPSSSSRLQPTTRHQSNSNFQTYNNSNNNTPTNYDPVPGDPGTVFIHPPFTDFPGSKDHQHKSGLTYNIMAANPEWFLDVNDFVGPNAVVYPPQLEPPRGWCPTKKKEAKDGWKEGEEPRLRCTLCRRQYAGVNAKSMWRRHVYEKHKIAMANRREVNDRPSARGGRGSNKENKVASKATEKEPSTRAAAKSVRRMVSLEVQQSNSTTKEVLHFPSPGLCQKTIEEAFRKATTFSRSCFDEEPVLTEGPSFSSSTPPQTPGVSPNKASMDPLGAPFNLVVPPESPYNPLMTPAFRHSPARLPSKQPWRFSPRNGQQIRDYTLAMLVRGESSPNVRGLDVSPIVLVPASERVKRSIFSPPRGKSLLSMSPRRLFTESAEVDSIQSRLDQPGWDIPTTPFSFLSGVDLYGEIRMEDFLRDFPDTGESEQVRSSSPFISANMVADNGQEPKLLQPTALCFRVPPLNGDQFSPNTRMFINGIKGPDSSPCPSVPTSPNTDDRSRRADVSSASKITNLTSTPLLPAFPAPPSILSSTDVFEDVRGSADSRMDVDDTDARSQELATPAKIKSSSASWQDIFNPTGASRTLKDGENSFLSSSSSNNGSLFAATTRSNLSVSDSSSHSRRGSSPSRPLDRNRARSVSNGGANTSGHKHSLGSNTATVGLMDAILDKKPRRRKHSHSEHRADGEILVNAFGSPFKMSKKTSRREFLYSLDGDCEMQEAQPRKRRKTISGQD